LKDVSNQHRPKKKDTSKQCKRQRCWEGASKEEKKDEWRMKGTTLQKNEKVADWLTPDVEL
jgi:hypothetical protein